MSNNEMAVKRLLGKALNNLKKLEIHPALKSAYSSIYGYTSDENGTRHANGIGEKNQPLEEAKYMLVSCSTFVNYFKENFEGKNGDRGNESKWIFHKGWKKLKLRYYLDEGSKEKVKDISNNIKKLTIKLNFKGMEKAKVRENMADKRPFI